MVFRVRAVDNAHKLRRLMYCTELQQPGTGNVSRVVPASPPAFRNVVLAEYSDSFLTFLSWSYTCIPDQISVNIILDLHF